MIFALFYKVIPSHILYTRDVIETKCFRKTNKIDKGDWAHENSKKGGIWTWWQIKQYSSPGTIELIRWILFYAECHGSKWYEIYEYIGTI